MAGGSFARGILRHMLHETAALSQCIGQEIGPQRN